MSGLGRGDATATAVLSVLLVAVLVGGAAANAVAAGVDVSTGVTPAHQSAPSHAAAGVDPGDTIDSGTDDGDSDSSGSGLVDDGSGDGDATDPVDDATNTTDATGNTTDTVENTTENTTDATENTTDTVENTTKNTTDATENTTDTVEETTDATENTTDTVEETTDATENTTDTVENTTDATENTTDTVEETTDPVETTTDTVEEPTETVEHAATEVTNATEETVVDAAGSVADTTGSVTNTVEEGAETVADTTREVTGSVENATETVVNATGGATDAGSLDLAGTDLPVSSFGNSNGTVDAVLSTSDNSARERSTAGDAPAGTTGSGTGSAGVGADGTGDTAASTDGRSSAASVTGDTDQARSRTDPVTDGDRAGGVFPVGVPAPALPIGAFAVGAAGGVAVLAGRQFDVAERVLSVARTATVDPFVAAARRRVEEARDRTWRWIAILGYQRYEDDDPLEHDLRAALYREIESEPGVHLSALSESVDAPLGTVRYHLKILAFEGLVTPTKDNGKRRYVPAGTDPDAIEVLLQDDPVAAVVDALYDGGPGSTTDIADRLDRDPSTVTHHVDRLEAEGVVERERDGRSVVTSLTDDARAAIARRRLDVEAPAEDPVATTGD